METKRISKSRKTVKKRPGPKVTACDNPRRSRSGEIIRCEVCPRCKNSSSTRMWQKANPEYWAAYVKERRQERKAEASGKTIKKSLRLPRKRPKLSTKASAVYMREYMRQRRAEAKG